ncbi:MAG: archaeosine biosynthesis radical SAM protein RaSEA [Promethearchaeota archaeon]|nr:MAG: archaeosine biosynthesis radical SAM protein RaSEA [Candidatus Lokiarchaeota archaeon]
MKANNISSEFNRVLSEKIKFIQQNAQKRKSIYGEEQLKRPVSFWTKNDRLKNEIGKEFTIILRTKGCNWALGEWGGCSMCGYFLDANFEDVPATHLINQFDYAFNDKINALKQDNNNYILKIFNSGSFLDENEIPKEVRKYIYNKILKVAKIKEFVIESRIEHITSEKLEELREFFDSKYIEIAIGLETVNDYVRSNYINKGFLFKDFKDTLKRCKEYGIGVKVYLLFKPLFMNEHAAIDDCVRSIKTLIELSVNSISINPMNIQKGTLTEYLWFQNRYRPPWFYSLFKCLKKSLTQKNLINVRVLSDPSGAGTKRGIHNCLKRDCENSAKEILKSFVLSQNLSILDQKGYECTCKKKYNLQKVFY